MISTINTTSRGTDCIGTNSGIGSSTGAGDTANASFDAMLSSACAGNPAAEAALLAPGGSAPRQYAGTSVFQEVNTDKTAITEAKVLGYTEGDIQDGLVLDDFLTEQQYLSAAEIRSALKSGKLDAVTVAAWDNNADGIITDSEVQEWNELPAELKDLVPTGVTGTTYNESDPFGSVIVADDALAIRYGDNRFHDLGDLPFDGDITQDWANGVFRSYTAELPQLTATLDCTGMDRASQSGHILTLEVNDPSKVRMGFSKDNCVLNTFVIDTDNDGVPDIGLDKSWLSNPENVVIKIGNQQMTLQDYVLQNESKGVGELVGWDSEIREAWKA